MEVWGGIECSLNRVGENYFDQLDYDNLYQKPEVFEQILNLGIKTLRFPILWEKVWPDKKKVLDWAVKKQLELLKANKVRVIAGLVHHGSGPQYAQIHEENFAYELAVYAKMVAKKFPWINDYTPINEPLTTARFCGLYGLWHPHARDDQEFLNILINECKATILAMRAIREVNSKARLVFTEDLTKIHGTSELKVQTTFENHRRWLSIDLICGKVDNTHPLWKYLIDHGIAEDRLLFFCKNPMPPDLLGFNYYVTSERYLDHKLDNHPPSTHGGNGYLAYADTEAVRHPDAQPAGLACLIQEAWQRYNLPMAITEAHLCCGREDQLRWLKSIWDNCCGLNLQGIHVVAVTFWSLFGAYGWDRLLTEKQGKYESGVFDLSSGHPRPTAVANLISSLGDGENYQSPVITGQGWWHRQLSSTTKIRPILIVSSSAILSNILAGICVERNLACVIKSIPEQEQFESAILKYCPWAIIQATDYLRPEEAEQEASDCFLRKSNHQTHLLKVRSDQNIHVLNFCHDKDTKANKIEAENHILTCLLSDVAVDSKRHLIQTSLDLLIDQETGIWHPANDNITWRKFS